MVMTWPCQSTLERSVRRITMRASVLGSASNTAMISSASRPSAVSKSRNRSAPRRLMKRTGGRPRNGIRASMPGTAAMRSSGLTVRPTPPLPTSTRRSQQLRKLIGELRGHTATERVADDRDPVDLEHAQQVAHPVGETGHRVVGPRLLGSPVPEQVRGDHGVVPGQLLDDGTPASPSCHRCRGSGGARAPSRP